MTGSDFLQAFLAAAPARQIRLAAARRLVPLPATEMLTLLVRLLQDEDAEVAGAAHSSLEGTPDGELLPTLRAADCPLEVFEHFSRPGTAEQILEAIALNNDVPGPVIASLASHAPGAVLDVILFNRVRLLEHPGIIGEIRRNPSITTAIERQLREIEQEFFSSKKQNYAVESRESEAVAEEQAEDVEELSLEELSLEGLPVEPAAREKALTDRLGTMAVPQKLRFAALGNRDVRAILIRDANKQVSRAVLKNPRLTDPEVESFARMRNVSEDVLRDIATSREWVRSYAVVHALIFNPKTPPALSQRMMSRLTTRDLVTATRDRGVSEIVRRAAQQTVAQRSRTNQRG